MMFVLFIFIFNNNKGITKQKLHLVYRLFNTIDLSSISLPAVCDAIEIVINNYHSFHSNANLNNNNDNDNNNNDNKKGNEEMIMDNYIPNQILGSLLLMKLLCHFPLEQLKAIKSLPLCSFLFKLINDIYLQSHFAAFPNFMQYSSILLVFSSSF